MAEFGRHPGRSGLRIPEAELRQIDAARLLHRADEILARHRLTIVPIEIKVRALTEVFRPKQRPHHADDLGPLVVDGGRVRSEEHTSELQSLMRISYAVFCLPKKKQKQITS